VSKTSQKRTPTADRAKRREGGSRRTKPIIWGSPTPNLLLVGRAGLSRSFQNQSKKKKSFLLMLLQILWKNNKIAGKEISRGKIETFLTQNLCIPSSYAFLVPDSALKVKKIRFFKLMGLAWWANFS
jgi:hypothetical protein